MRHVVLVVLLLVALDAAAAAAQPVQASTQPASGTRADVAQETLLVRLRAWLLGAQVPAGLELRPFQIDLPGSEPLPPRVVRQPAVNVEIGPRPQTGRAALESFVTANAGYELVAGRPVFAVRPAGVAADSHDCLNTPVDTYEVHDATAVEALTQLLHKLDSRFDSSHIKGTMEVSPRRISLSLSHVMVRDVLDAIVGEYGGSAVWMASFTGTTSSFGTARIEIASPESRMHVTAFGGAPPADLPVRMPGPMPSLVPLPLSVQTLRNTILAIARQTGMLAGFELAADCAGREASADHLALDLFGLDMAESVRLLTAHCPAYEQRTINGVVNVGPIGSFDRSPVLNLRARNFGVASMPFRDALYAVRQAFNPYGRPMSAPPPPRMPSPGFGNVPADRAAAMAADMMKPVDVKLTKPTLRDALNALIVAHGSAYWIVDPDPSGTPRITFGGQMWQTAVTFSAPR